MTPTKLKAAYLAGNPGGRFFSREIMRHWSDRLTDFGCCRCTVDDKDAWCLYRKRQRPGVNLYFFEDVSFKFLQVSTKEAQGPLTKRQLCYYTVNHPKGQQ